MSAPASLGSQKTGGIALPASGLYWLHFAVIALVAEMAVIWGVSSSEEWRGWLPFLLPAAHLLLIPFLLRNFSLWGARLVLFGLLLNLVAMALNGGLMPVAPDAVEAIGKHDPRELRLGDPIPGTKNVLLESDQTHALWLSDAIVLPISRPYRRAVSVGDFVVVGGVVSIFVEVARRHPYAGRSDAAG